MAEEQGKPNKGKDDTTYSIVGAPAKKSRDEEHDDDEFVHELIDDDAPQDIHDTPEPDEAEEGGDAEAEPEAEPEPGADAEADAEADADADADAETDDDHEGAYEEDEIPDVKDVDETSATAGGHKGKGKGKGKGKAEPDDEESLPTMATIESLIARADYARICKLLGPPDRASDLPPGIAIIYAVAHKEAGDETESADVNFLAIRSVAALLGVSEESRTALMIAKRVLRRTPRQWGKRKAPPAPARIFLIIVGLAVGAVVGWLAGPGGVRIIEVFRSMLN